MGEALVLRPFRRTDLAAAFALDQVCFPPGIAYSRSELRSFVARPSAYCIVAQTAGLMAGFLVGSHSNRRRHGMAHIVTLDVAPSLRRAGVASALMQEALGHYMETGQGGVELEVAVNNEAAQRFYLKHGFLAVGLIRGYYHGGLDAIAMRKTFAGDPA